MIQMSRKLWWVMKRFGLTPDKVYRRMVNKDVARVMCVSIPKAGTHMLERCLCMHPQLYRKLVRTINDNNLDSWGGFERLLETLKPGQILLSHLFYNKKRVQCLAGMNVHGVFLIRDPRDIVVSRAFYVAQEVHHPFHRVFKERGSNVERFQLAIKGDAETGLLSIGEILSGYQGWLNGTMLKVRYEDLIGPQGGQPKEAQVATVKSIYEFLGLPLEDHQVRRIADRVFSSASPTFRKGSIGQWKKQFDQGTKEMFKRVAGEMLIRLGYEHDENW